MEVVIPPERPNEHVVMSDLFSPYARHFNANLRTCDCGAKNEKIIASWHPACTQSGDDEYYIVTKTTKDHDVEHAFSSRTVRVLRWDKFSR